MNLPAAISRFSAGTAAICLLQHCSHLPPLLALRRALHAGHQLSVDDLARRYGADPEVLRHFLHHNTGPVVHAARDGRLVGSWPDE